MLTTLKRVALALALVLPASVANAEPPPDGTPVALPPRAAMCKNPQDALNLALTPVAEYPAALAAVIATGACAVNNVPLPSVVVESAFAGPLEGRNYYIVKLATERYAPDFIYVFYSEPMTSPLGWEI